LIGDPELNRYIDFYFEEEDVDWYKPADKIRNKRRRINAEKCTAEHFGPTADDKRLLNDWAGYNLACMEKGEENKVKFHGDKSSMISRNLVFKVDKCNSKLLPTGVTCHADAEKYIYDLTVLSWYIQDTMDFSNFEKERPVYRVEESAGRNLLKKDSRIRKDQFL
jgi:hypothetical protein